MRRGATMSVRARPSRTLASRWRRERGAVAVEFALVLPILLSLVFGIIQFGFILAQQNALNGAVRTGARYGSVNAFSGSHNCGNVVTRVQDSAVTIGVDKALIEVSVERDGSFVCGTAGGLTGTPPCEDPLATPAMPANLSVKATYESEFLVPVPFAGNSITLESEGVYQCEYH
jgi:Flp pilus assembly protein TadG